MRSLMKDVADDIVRDTHGRLSHEIQTLAEDSKAMDYLGRLLKPLEPWTGWAMNPAAVLTVVSDILMNRRSVVVECGAGLSTLYAAKALSLQGGRLISFESDPAWADRTKRQLTELGLASHVALVEARLTQCMFGDEQYLWYDIATVKEHLAPAGSVDLLVVDGPSQSVCRHARYPALPVVKPHLGQNYGIILHDTDRVQEKETVDLWRREIAAEFINDYRARRVAYARGGHFYEV
jgi:hypothetical protein